MCWNDYQKRTGQKHHISFFTILSGTAMWQQSRTKMQDSKMKLLNKASCDLCFGEGIGWKDSAHSRGFITPSLVLNLH